MYKNIDTQQCIEIHGRNINSTLRPTTRIDSYQKRISPSNRIINNLCYLFNILLLPSQLTIFFFSSPYLQSPFYFSSSYQYTTIYKKKKKNSPKSINRRKLYSMNTQKSTHNNVLTSIEETLLLDAIRMCFWRCNHSLSNPRSISSLLSLSPLQPDWHLRLHTTRYKINQNSPARHRKTVLKYTWNIFHKKQ